MACRKILDDREHLVDDLLQGLQAAYPGNHVLPGTRALVRVAHSAQDSTTDSTATAQAAAAPQHVGLVSGGGSGHEPFSAGFVGAGMLSAAVAGDVFASPPASHIVRAIKYVAKMHPGGVLLIVANYTGDCLNFGLAAQLAKNDGIQVESVIVADDCALLETGVSVAGRRGMCGLVIVFKLAGQQAAEGAPLADVADTARRLTRCMATMGLASAPCSLPGAATPLFTLEPGYVELGLGVHGEAGIDRIKMAPASVLVEDILKRIIKTLKLEQGNEVVVLINNLGSLSQLEQWVVTGIVKKQLDMLGIIVCRLYSGSLMTSLEMAGFQVCVLNLSSSEASRDDWLRWLDSSTPAPAWPASALSIPTTSELEMHSIFEDDELSEDKGSGPELQGHHAHALRTAVQGAAEALIIHSDKLNELDSGCGDGDCGSTLARLAKGILSKLSHLRAEFPASMLLQLAALSSTLMGGTSGAIYGLLFSAASHELSQNHQQAEGQDLLHAAAKAWHSGVKGIMQYSSARLGDRTMLDALVPACEEFTKSVMAGEDCLTGLKKAIIAAKKGCEMTSTMEARAGRASYVNTVHLGDVDAGAFGVVALLEGAYSALCGVM